MFRADENNHLVMATLNIAGHTITGYGYSMKDAYDKVLEQFPTLDKSLEDTIVYSYSF
jgi:hypothetical protein